jgi:hypothetical protein
MIDYQFKEELNKTRERVEDLFQYEGFKVGVCVTSFMEYLIRYLDNLSEKCMQLDL